MTESLITAGMADALRAGWPLVLLAQIDHPDGMVYLHSGIGTINYDGSDWLGMGMFGDVGPVTISTETVIPEVAFTLSGVEPSEASLQFLNANVRNRIASVWLGCLNPSGQIVERPFQLLQAQMDYQTQEVDDEGGEVVIQIIARSGFYTLERAIDECWTSENQKKRYPGDTGLDLVTTLQDKDILWTRTT